jgi:L-ascorbate metabolism protein UlaG (beta-lactamase superfamily)
MRKLERAKKSGRKFLNPVETSVGDLSLMLKLIPLYFRNKEEREPKQPLGPFYTDKRSYEREPASGLRVTWFGHSSELVEIDGVRVLIDPVWDKRAAPVSWFGPKRFFAPTLPIDALPELDAVLISHDHYDHLGKKTIQALARMRPELRWVCPLGVAKLLHGYGVPAGRVAELDWTQDTVIAGHGMGAELRVTALPARHFSGRSLTNRFETLWASYVLKSAQHTIYYGADSGLWDGFETIAREYGPFDLTMLEIGAFHPLWHQIHLGPDGAVETFERLGGGVLMPIHWGLFNLALHGWRQPIDRLEELASARRLTLFVPTPGEPTEFTGEAVRSEWWKSNL